MTKTGDYNLLRMAAPFILLGLCVLSLLIPPLALLLPLIAMWIDGRTGGIGATLSLTLTGGIMMGLLFGIVGVAASLCISGPAIAARVLLKRGTPYANGFIPMLLTSFATVLAAVLTLYMTLGGDIVGRVTEAMRAGIMQTPGSAASDALAMAAAYISMVQDPAAASDAANVVASFRAMSLEALLDIMIPYFDFSLRISLPSYALQGVLILGGGTWMAGSYLIRGARRKGRSLPAYLQEASHPRDFGEFSLPGWISGPLILIMVAVFFLQMFGGENLLAMTMAAQSLVTMVFTVQGMALVSWWCTHRKKKPIGMGGRIALLALGLVLMGGEILFLLGAADSMFHFRQVSAMREALLKKMQEQAREHKNDDDDNKEE